MLISYTRRGQHEEAWQLVQQAFSVVNDGGQLCDHVRVRLLERIINGYKESGLHEEAWQVTQRIYGYFVRMGPPLCD
jgi:hypothetical protein